MMYSCVFRCFSMCTAAMRFGTLAISYKSNSIIRVRMGPGKKPDPSWVTTASRPHSIPHSIPHPYPTL